MTLFPKSLRGRTLVLMLTAILACQGFTLGILAAYRHNFLGSRSRDFMATHVLLLQEAMRHTPPAELAHDLEQAPGGRRMRLFPAPPPDATADPPATAAYPSRLVEQLRTDYGADAVRFSTHPAVALWVRVPPSGWWIMIPAARFEVPIPWPTVYATLGAVALMTVLVALFAMHLSRPLNKLADAAREFEVGKRPQLPLAGPEEVRDVTVQFNAMAERLAENDAERRVMLAGLPHDLRAPLARAKLRLALLEEGDRVGFERDLLEIERIADQFVAYLRGLDHDTSRFQPVNLAHLIEGRVHAWTEAGQDVAAVTVDEGVVSGDEDALKRALDNLVSNALAHGAAPVRLLGQRTAEGYRIEVRDAGPGIPESLRLEALQPFVRLDDARGAAAAPTAALPPEARSAFTLGGHCGLGLAVVQAVSKLHGGRILLENLRPTGLAATIFLPASAA